MVIISAPRRPACPMHRVVRDPPVHLLLPFRLRRRCMLARAVLPRARPPPLRRNGPQPPAAGIAPRALVKNDARPGVVAAEVVQRLLRQIGCRSECGG